MNFKDIDQKLFGDETPREAFLYQAHPLIKIVIIPLFFTTVWFSNNIFQVLTLLIIHIFVVKLSKKSLNIGLLLYPWIVVIAYLYYQIEVGDISNITIKHPPYYLIKAYLLITPILHISQTINAIELSHTVPVYLRPFSLLILSFSRYISVTKEQFISTKNAFYLRGASIKEKFFEHFITTLILNIGRHSNKYSDNLQIRNIDSFNNTTFKLSFSYIDSILLSIFFIATILTQIFLRNFAI